MAIKKSEIYSQIWAACDKLRGGVEPARYKDYILTLLFVKYVSDRFKSNDSWDIEVPPGGSFDDIVKLKGTKNIGEGIDTVIGTLAAANNLKGIIDIAFFNGDEFGTGKEAVDKLSDLIAIFQKPELDFRYNRAGGDDILGDAYEFLMQNFAKESGKSKGQFYTPGEVSRIMAQVIGIDKATGSDKTLYDPACGSGSLLIRAADAAPKKADGTPNVAIFGQEKTKETAGLARMNFVLHNMGTADVAGNKSTLANPHFKDERNPNLLKTFDYIVMNPPFSDKSWMDGMNITVKGDKATEQYGRFDGYKVPPEKNGDYAWFLHVLRSLKSTGKAAIILPHGVLFRGNAEADIRNEIINRGYIKGIIGLPANLFFGTGIPACIIVIDKEDASGRQGIFMIDASEGYIKDGNKNRLREQDIHKIVTVFKHQIEIDKYSRFVPNDEIKITNEYNLNIPRYIDSSEPEDLQDINAHLNGGIPETDIESMADYWAVYPSMKDMLFKPLRHGYIQSAVEKDDVVSIITSHEEFISHANMVDDAYTAWKDCITPILMQLTQGNDPKTVIRDLSELLLSAFSDVPLIDNYDIYQKLMEYWEETMQDDVYAVCFEGYDVGRKIAYEYVKKKKKVNGVTIEETTDKVKSYEGEIIPKSLIIKHFYPDELESLQKHQSELDTITAQLEELVEENSNEDGYFSFLNDMKAVTIKTRIKDIQNDTDSTAELEALQEYLRLSGIESDAKKLIREATTMLDIAAREKYEQLTDEEIKQLLVEEKWLRAIYNGIDAIHSAVSHRIYSRITELVERYEFTLPECEAEVAELENKVKSHLKRMGFVW
ncbi:HsdM family class I SAM-dependent methyltransferase [Paenibacillus chibensis]|uniref:HsdM family class I SAM-dependent methyltransferase n=1 Tax=Paenibacillus chibensis TaxID=59846 RepID=UPI000FD831A7|nr:class I SAM-dependent DNA methyltransferase [Paenibacillus chibensis]MEC0373568.1 N-6 DNA methylase [Paenibacillus chibensis]